MTPTPDFRVTKGTLGWYIIVQGQRKKLYFLEVFSKMTSTPHSRDPRVFHQGTRDFFYCKQPLEQNARLEFYKHC